MALVITIDVRPLHFLNPFLQLFLFPFRQVETHLVMGIKGIGKEKAKGNAWPFLGGGEMKNCNI